MIYDMHVHMPGFAPDTEGPESRPLAKQGIMLRHFAKRLGVGDSECSGIQHGDSLKQRFLTWAETSSVDRLVVLALDAAYHANGTPDWENTQWVSDNDDVADFVSEHDKLCFGASIHPARPDAIDTLERVAERGACLVKWIPSAQNICPDDSRFIPFYEALAHHRIPLLVHTGNEHTLRSFSNSLNNPERLTVALQCGVTVIGAHCGTRLFLHEKSYFRLWKRMALDYERFYGDLSAFILPLHGGPLKEILRDHDLRSKVIYGSDFPVIPMLYWHTAKLGVPAILKLRQVNNLIEQAYLTMKQLGVPDEVFERAEKLLSRSQESTEMY